MDAELSGEPVPGWRLGAGYTYNENEDPDGARLSLLTPQHMLKAWTNLRLPGASNRWQVGGSLHAQSRITGGVCLNEEACGSVRAVQPAYGVLNLRTAFDIDRNWQLALSVNNVFDKVYYESIESGLHAWYGAPRNWMLKAEGRF